MRIAVTFCNQRYSPTLALASVSSDTDGWVELPKNDHSLGATGVVRIDDRLIVAIQESAPRTTLVSLDRNWRTQDVLTLGPVRDAHDIAITDDGILVTSTGTDELYLDDHVIFRASSLQRDEHHLNGVTSDGERTLITMFGAKRDRSWSKVADGRLVDIARGTLIEGLHHPHSPRLTGGQVWVCDSGRGELVVSEGREHRIPIGGYTRGLWVGDDVVILGISAARSRSRSEGTTNILASGENDRVGIVFIDRHKLTILDRWELSGLGGEIFDLARVDDFETLGGRGAHQQRAIHLAERITQLEQSLEQRAVSTPTPHSNRPSPTPGA